MTDAQAKVYIWMQLHNLSVISYLSSLVLGVEKYSMDL